MLCEVQQIPSELLRKTCHPIRIPVDQQTAVQTLLASNFVHVYMQAAHHPQLGESMTQLALAYSLFVSSLTEIKPDSQLFYATDSFRSLSGSQKQGMHDLLVQLKEALPLTPPVAEANASSGASAAGTSTTGIQLQICCDSN